MNQPRIVLVFERGGLQRVITDRDVDITQVSLDAKDEDLKVIRNCGCEYLRDLDGQDQVRLALDT